MTYELADIDALITISRSAEVRTSLMDVRNAMEDLHKKLSAALAENATLREALASTITHPEDLARDAARYRWLRDHYIPIWHIKSAHELPMGGWVLYRMVMHGEAQAWSEISKDAAIDAAMKETTK